MSAFTFKQPQLFSRLGAQFVPESTTNSKKDGSNREGTLAETLRPAGLAANQDFDVVKDFRWTLTNLTNDDIEETPYIRLKEFKIVDGSIKRQVGFYTSTGITAFKDAITNPERSGLQNMGVLGSYKEIWPQDDPSGFTYKLPYFNKTNLEISSESWTDLKSIGDNVKSVAGGFAGLFGQKAGQVAEKTVDLLIGGTKTALELQFPDVGVVDRPKVFAAHSDRTITISFTLFNTFSERDWAANRELMYIIMSQNLFNKRDYITGIPPVFYSLYIPGQYFCWAAYMSNFKVENLGNQRLLDLDGQKVIIPDAYQVELSLTELVKPSKNQFEAVTTGEALQRVTVDTQRDIQANNTTNGFSPVTNGVGFA